jgi:drug/metabolite transporter (DMT)-like permease
MIKTEEKMIVDDREKGERVEIPKPVEEPAGWRRYLPHIILALHIIENTASVLQVRLSKSIALAYIPSVACILVELFKTVIAFCIVLAQEKTINLELAFPWFYAGGMKNFLKLSVPSILYTISANLIHFGMYRLHVPLFQVLYNFRIVATVIISSFLFAERKYSTVKWCCCISLFVGIVIANLDPFFAGVEVSTPALPPTSPPSATIASSSGLATASLTANLADGLMPETAAPTSGMTFPAVTITQYILAAVAVAAAGVSTASAGVYSEKLLKETMATMSPWMRNIQFGTLGVLYTSMLALKDYEEIWEKGPFYGFETQVWLMALNQAIGGLIVALVLFYLDSVIRSFAGSASFLLCTLISVLFLGFHIHTAFLVGSLIILGATYFFSIPDGQPLVPKLIRNLYAVETRD